MKKYSIIRYKIVDKNLEKITEISEEHEKKALHSSNVIYLYRNSKNIKFYIGQTSHFYTRHKEHYTNDLEVFDKACFDEVMVVVSQEFNMSAIYDIESQLISYFMADYDTSKNKVMYDSEKVLNKNKGLGVNTYYNREIIENEIIIPLWEEVLYPLNWVKSPKIKILRNNVLIKYSPIKELSNEQEELILEILNNSNKNYVVNGTAGTGKTLVLVRLIAFLLEETNKKIGVVVLPNWIDKINQIFSVYGLKRDNVMIMTSTMLINTRKKFDIIIIDEAQKLSRKYGRQQPSFNEVYKIEEYKNCQSHLEILQKMGSQIVLMYDVLQAIRPCNIDRYTFKDLTKDYEKRFIKTQFRIHVPKGKSYTSEDYIDGIKYLLYKDTGLLESEYVSFNPNFNREVFNDKSLDAYFGYVLDQPLHQLANWLQEDRNFFPEHVNRILAGLFVDWKLSDGSKIEKKHFFENEMALRWNSTQNDWLFIKAKDAEEQVGSVFAVQGLDLNKVGVLIGPDLKVENGSLVADVSNFRNQNGVFTKEEMKNPDNQKEFTLFVLNIYYILLTRGIDGIRIGFWNNKEFKNYMEKTFNIKK